MSSEKNNTESSEEKKTEERKKCSSCKAMLLLKEFVNADGKNKATCNDCRAKKQNKHNCETCGVKALYNVPGEEYGRFCAKHKEVGMIHVGKGCHYKGCIVNRPVFNFTGKTKGLYCSEHKQPGMVDVISPKCIQDGCNKQPAFNLKGETTGLYCSEHKQPGMINVVSPKCIQDGCNVIPNFNVKGETKGLYCSEHKQPGMVDVKSPTCIQDGCNTFAHFGYIGTIKTHCTKHKLPFMFKKCKTKCTECKELAIYGKSEPLHCESHAKDVEICFLRATCTQCNEIDILNREGLCMTKCSLVKLDIASKKHQKLKETLMCEYLNSSCKDLESEFKVVDDSSIDTNCNLYRPDRKYDCGTHMVIVECDEFQHKNKPLCVSYRNLQHAEKSRMYAIQQACGGIPCIFIRWNPDTFRINDVVCKKYNMNKRLELLSKWVKHCIKMEITSTSPPKYIELFYDNFQEINTEFTTIEEKDII